MSLPLSRRFRTPTRFRRVAVAACAVVLPGLASLPAAHAAVAVAAVKPDSIGTSSAAGLRVLVSKSNLMTLVWMHDTVAAESGPEGDKIAIATAQGGAHLTPETDVSAGPSFGTLLDATLAPNGSI